MFRLPHTICLDCNLLQAEEQSMMTECGINFRKSVANIIIHGALEKSLHSKVSAYEIMML